MRTKIWNQKHFVIPLTLSAFLITLSYLKSSSDEAFATRTLQFSYAFTVANIPSDSKQVEIWLPVPRSDLHQSITNLKITSDYPYAFLEDPKYHNAILKIAAKEKIPARLPVSMQFTVTRSSYRLLEKRNLFPNDADKLTVEQFLLPDRLIPIDKKITKEASAVVGEEMSKFEKARALYDHVVSTMVYDKSGTGWGLGNALYACDARRGNCTDFHSLFIGLARASGIPARFVIGFPIPAGIAKGQIPGYHCWAEFYLNDRGWVPIDASEAFKHPEKRDLFFGGLDENRVQFTVGRDIPLAADENIEPLNYFIYPYVRIDGKIYSDVEYHFSFSDL